MKRSVQQNIVQKTGQDLGAVVLLTRRRWKIYMLVLLVLTLPISTVMVWTTGEIRFASLPMGVIPLWALLHFRTPPEGMPVKTIRSTPGAILMLWFAAATVIVALIMAMIDIWVFGKPLNGPLEAYHVLLFAPPFIILFTGAFLAGRIQQRAKMVSKK